MSSHTIRLPKTAIADLLMNQAALAVRGFTLFPPKPSTTPWASIRVDTEVQYFTSVELAMALGRVCGWKSRHLS